MLTNNTVKLCFGVLVLVDLTLVFCQSNKATTKKPTSVVKKRFLVHVFPPKAIVTTRKPTTKRTMKPISKPTTSKPSTTTRKSISNSSLVLSTTEMNVQNVSFGNATSGKISRQFELVTETNAERPTVVTGTTEPISGNLTTFSANLPGSQLVEIFNRISDIFNFLTRKNQTSSTSVNTSTIQVNSTVFEAFRLIEISLNYLSNVFHLPTKNTSSITSGIFVNTTPEISTVSTTEITIEKLTPLYLNSSSNEWTSTTRIPNVTVSEFLNFTSEMGLDLSSGTSGSLVYVPPNDLVHVAPTDLISNATISVINENLPDNETKVLNSSTTEVPNLTTGTKLIISTSELPLNNFTISTNTTTNTSSLNSTSSNFLTPSTDHPLFTAGSFLNLSTTEVPNTEPSLNITNETKLPSIISTSELPLINSTTKFFPSSSVTNQTNTTKASTNQPLFNATTSLPNISNRFDLVTMANGNSTENKTLITIIQDNLKYLLNLISDSSSSSNFTSAVNSSLSGSLNSSIATNGTGDFNAFNFTETLASAISNNSNTSSSLLQFLNGLNSVQWAKNGTNFIFNFFNVNLLGG